MLRSVCDSCGMAATSVYCYTDSTYLCSGCDTVIHGAANPMACGHGRIPVLNTAPSSPSLMFGASSAVNQCQGEAASDDGFFYNGTGNCEYWDDLFIFASSCSNEIWSCGSHHENQQVPIAACCLELNQGLQPAETPAFFAHPPAENPITREERVRRFREKRKSKRGMKKIYIPSKKAYAASIRPRINGKFAKRAIDKKVD